MTPAASVLPVFPVSVTPAIGHMLDGPLSYVRYPLRPDTFSPPLRPNRPMSTPPVHDMDTDTELDFLESPNTMSGDRSPTTDDITTTPPQSQQSLHDSVDSARRLSDLGPNKSDGNTD